MKNRTFPLSSQGRLRSQTGPATCCGHSSNFMAWVTHLFVKYDPSPHASSIWGQRRNIWTVCVPTCLSQELIREADCVYRSQRGDGKKKPSPLCIGLANRPRCRGGYGAGGPGECRACSWWQPPARPHLCPSPQPRVQLPAFNEHHSTENIRTMLQTTCKP